MVSNDAQKVFDEYYGFDDGVLKAFEYDFSDDGACSIRLELYARNYNLEGNVWRDVEIWVRGVSEVRSTVIPVVINSKIKLVDLGGGLCLEVNGDFGLDSMSIENIRRYSFCYVIGRSVEIVECV
ncbi:hypothetical protein [Pseudomonas oryziphila]|uniref:Immunity protein 50 n=1 Tax=Pseudomonas oryziphila TaxID=2894079 RepID=A0ABN5TMS7_9PSED|nr:hypothetical protein [Pseudomonas oryziphila]AZL75662.1 hypothetical protein EI693_22270 [Pseudomonas oryziphila]